MLRGVEGVVGPGGETRPGAVTTNGITTRNHKSGAAARAGWPQWMVIVSRENQWMVKAQFSQPVLVLSSVEKISG